MKLGGFKVKLLLVLIIGLSSLSSFAKAKSNHKSGRIIESYDNYASITTLTREDAFIAKSDFKMQAGADNIKFSCSILGCPDNGEYFEANDCYLIPRYCTSHEINVKAGRVFQILSINPLISQNKKIKKFAIELNDKDFYMNCKFTSKENIGLLQRTVYKKLRLGSADDAN